METVGTMHDYLGMTFDYSFTKEVRINMWDYLRNAIKEFPKEITGVCATPASDHLFKVQEDGRKLSKELEEVFHHTVSSSSLRQTERDMISKWQCCSSPLG
jgi:hypothetical protein